jgi:hypothetical protein
VLLVWLAVFTVGFIAIAVTAGPTKQRRSHFWVRVLLLALAMPALPLIVIGGVALSILPEEAAFIGGLLSLWACVAGLMLMPTLLYRGMGSSPDSSDDDGGGGGGPGPDRPPRSPTKPRGGVPLPDAEQALLRLRDHNHPRFGGLKRQRGTREPVRSPTPLRH